MKKVTLMSPDEIYLSFSKRTEGSTPYGHLTYVEKGSAFDKRKSSINSRANHNWREHSLTLKNEPLYGYEFINGSIGNDYNSEKNLCIYDPRGFLQSLSPENTFEIIKYGTIQNGKILNRCIWGWNGKPYLMLDGSPSYQEAYTYFTKRQNKISSKLLKPGNIVLNNHNKKLVYLGMYYTLRAKPVDRNSSYNTSNPASDIFSFNNRHHLLLEPTIPGNKKTDYVFSFKKALPKIIDIHDNQEMSYDEIYKAFHTKECDILNEKLGPCEFIKESWRPEATNFSTNKFDADSVEFEYEYRDISSQSEFENLIKTRTKTNWYYVDPFSYENETDLYLSFQYGYRDIYAIPFRKKEFEQHKRWSPLTRIYKPTYHSHSHSISYTIVSDDVNRMNLFAKSIRIAKIKYKVKDEGGRIITGEL